VRCRYGRPIMRVTANLYPWDLARLGVDRVLAELVEWGIDSVDLAATYHPIDALSPRDLGFYSSSRGAVHFPARPERYGRIAPSLSSPEVCAAWPAAAERVGAAGLRLHAWTITLFQPWITDAHPDTARVFVGGDASSTGVCPANEQFREYLSALCADLVDQFGVDMIRLESVMPLGFNVDWLRSRVLVDVPDLARDLLTLCFCATCTRRGTDAGLDVERLRASARDVIDADLAGDGESRRDATLADTELAAFLAQHEQASIELCVAVRAAVGEATRLASTISTPFHALRRGAGAELTAQLAEIVDQLAVSSAGGKGNQRIAAIAAAASRPVALDMLITRGLRFPGMATPDGAPGEDPIDAQLREATALGVEEVSLYNYGLLRDADVQRFMDKVRGLA
jgi:hypothetical protein